jgi:Uma2 family endonuclease
MPVSEKTFLTIALEEPNQWELHCGRLVRKPGMTFEHNEVAHTLGFQLGEQLDRNQYRVRIGMGHARRSSESYYIPDVCVILIELTRELRGRRNVLEAYASPLPLVVEVWSPSTGDYDVDSKLPEYQARGDLEIWRIHPFEHTLRARRRQQDGTYSVSEVTSGIVQPVALPGVSIVFDALFD